MPTVPTKANLDAAKRSLRLAKLGYELLDRKQSIMMRELNALVGEAEKRRAEMSQAFAEAYDALRRANISVGARTVEQIAESMAVRDDVTVLVRSVMGVEVPETRMADPPPPRIVYGLGSTTPEVDDAYLAFTRARRCAVAAAQTENAVRRLARSVRSAKKRVGALSGIVIPRLEAEIALIASALEERERDSFTSLKVIKRRGESK